MSVLLRVKKNYYQDSVKLMRISQIVKSLPGVLRASAIMGTENNKATLVRGGFDASLMDGAGPSDILFLVDATTEELAALALDRYLALIDETTASKREQKSAVRTIKAAVSSLPGSNIAFISVPGEFAAYEAHKALRAGLHVHLFSDNVPIEDEIRLKELGRKLGLLVMGPDCGTSIIGGTPIGFANVVSQGPVGIIGASGTGIQQVSVLVDRYGSGISHAIGLGGRDLSDRVGGISALMALDAMEHDTTTRVLVFISKPPGPATGKKIVERIKACAKPVVIVFLGGDPKLTQDLDHVANDLEEAARMAVELAVGRGLAPESDSGATGGLVAGHIGGATGGLVARRGSDASSRKFLRGLFTGGSLADEAQLILGKFLGPVRSNCTANPALRISGSDSFDGHAIIDMGDDEFTVGRPHPMIDPSYRAERILKEWSDPRVAVILCDVVLGYGSHQSPATPVAEAVKRARVLYGDDVTVVASVCGTEGDPQVLSRQEAILREAGILVLPTNASAARTAGLAAQGHAERSER
jgi:FdrA protein